jgi:rod shape-determining protein MreC
VAEVQPKNAARGRNAVPVILLAASLACLVVSTRSLVGLPERIGVTVLGFFQRGIRGVVSGTIASIEELRRLRQEYDQLVVKLEQYTNIERGLADLRAENLRLKEQLGVARTFAFERVSARIIAKDPANLYSTIVIDKGGDEGIRKNMPVIAIQDGLEGLVGRVIEAGKGSSIVVPVYDSTSFVSARLSKARHEGLVGGSGSADEPLLMRFVKKRAKDEAQFGDLVVTSGYESVYPAEVAIGRVRKVRDLEYQTSVDIELDPVLDFSRLEFVFVVKVVTAKENGFR